MANAIKVSVLGDVKDINQKLGSVDKQLSGIGKSVSKAGSLLKSALVGGAVIGGISLLAGKFKEASAAVQEQEKLMAQTNAVLKSTGAQAGVTAKGVKGLADALEAKSTIDSEAIQNGENLLLTFTNIQNRVGKGNDIFNQATQTIVDMSTALGQDTKTSAIQLGKALNDPIKGVTALTKVGVSFTAQQKEQIKTMVKSGDVAGAQKIILAELNKEFGGSAAAASNTAAGQLKHLKDSVDDVFESIVKVAIPILFKLTGAIKNSFVFKQVVLGIKAFVSAIKEGDVTSNGFVGVMERLGNVIRDVYFAARGFFEVLKNGGEVTDSGLSGAMERLALTLRNAFAKAKEFGNFFKQNILPDLITVGNIVKNVVVTAFNALLGTFKALIPVGLAIAQFIGDHIVLFKALAVGVLAIVAAVKLYQGALAIAQIATKAFAAAQLALNIIMSLNPIGIVILALVGLAAAVVYAYKHSEKFRNILDTVWNAIKTGIKFIANLYSKFIGAFAGIITAALRMQATVIGFFIRLPGNIVRAVGNTAKTLYNAGRNLIVGLARGYSSFLGTLARTIGKLGSSALTWVGNLGSKLYEAGKDLVRGLINGIKAMAGEVAKAAGDVVQGAINKAKSVLHIGSPSKVFRDIGRDTVAGLIIGLKPTGVARAASTLANSTITGFTTPDVAFAGAGAGAGMGVTNINLTVQSLDPRTAATLVVDAIDNYNSLHGKGRVVKITNA